MFVKGKKGDVTDTLVFTILVFILVVGFFIISFVVPNITEGLRVAGLNNTPEGANAITELDRFGTITIQRGVFFLVIGLMISTLISSFLIRTHPIFKFLYIIFLGLSVFIGTYLANGYDSIRNVAIFSTQLANQTLMNLIMENLILIIISVGALSMIIIFAKFSSFGRSVQGQL